MGPKPPRTTPHGSGRFQCEGNSEKLDEVQKHIPRTPEMIKFIIGNHFVEDEQLVEESEIDKSEEAENYDEEKQKISGEERKRTRTKRRHSVRRRRRSKQLLETTADEEDIQEARKEAAHYRKFLSDQFSKEETGEEIKEEKPYDNIEGRDRELRKQEEENERYVQELSDNDDDVLESKYNELKKNIDNDINNLLRYLRGFKDLEDLEDLKEDIEAALKEESASSIESSDNEEK